MLGRSPSWQEKIGRAEWRKNGVNNSIFHGKIHNFCFRAWPAQHSRPVPTTREAARPCRASLSELSVNPGRRHAQKQKLWPKCHILARYEAHSGYQHSAAATRAQSVSALCWWPELEPQSVQNVPFWDFCVQKSWLPVLFFGNLSRHIQSATGSSL